MEEFFTKKEIIEMIISKKKKDFHKELIESCVKPAAGKGLWSVTLEIPYIKWANEEVKRLREFGYSVSFDEKGANISWHTPFAMTEMTEEELVDLVEKEENEYIAIDAYNETKTSIEFYMDFCKKLIKQKLEGNEYIAVDAYNETKDSIDFYMDFCKKLIKQKIDVVPYKEIFLGQIPKEVEDEITTKGFILNHGEGIDPHNPSKKKVVKGVFIVIPNVE